MALQELRESDERAEKIVVLRLGGLTNEEIAVALGLGERTVIRDWRSARALIASRLS
jgi:DNA-binding CsgD family transcriptional regulator